MLQLTQAIPDPEMLLSLSTEELAAKMLFLLRKRGGQMFHPDSMQNELWGDRSRGYAGYPQDRKSQIELAVAEAWAWLLAQGFILPAAGMNGTNGWRRLSRRAHTMELEADSPAFKSHDCCRESSTLKWPTRSGAPSCAENMTSPFCRL